VAVRTTVIITALSPVFSLSFFKYFWIDYFFRLFTLRNDSYFNLFAFKSRYFMHHSVLHLRVCAAVNKLGVVLF